jgi:hypothetical protein
VQVVDDKKGRDTVTHSRVLLKVTHMILGSPRKEAFFVFVFTRAAQWFSRKPDVSKQGGVRANGTS